MSHVDEGTLHAYLDGELPPSERASLEAHIAQCATCRALLADERALLERSTALLASARPVERPVPPFEQVRRASKRPWYLRTPVAWAASIILALGLGYYVRDAGDRLSPAAFPSQPVGASQERYQSADTGAPLDAAPASVATRQDRAFAPRPAEVASANKAAAIDSLGRRDSNVVSLVEPRVALRGAVAGAAQREADSLAPLGDSALRLNEVVITAAPSPQGAGAQGRLAAPSARRAERQSVRDLLSTSWPVISRGAAASLLGDKPVGVPGLVTRRIRRSPGADSTVVVEQALDSSTVIQIFQRPAGDVVTVDGFAVSGVERARGDRVLARYVGRLRVEISGPVSTDSLNKLLEQVEPLP